MKRSIVHIDEELCDGCGLCVPSCAEGAIQIVDGKARLLSEVYCDGLGACLGECPQDAISIVEREAEAFDEQAAQRHLGAPAASSAAPARPAPRPLPISAGCPGVAARALSPEPAPAAPPGGPRASELRNWPVQLHLVPIRAPWLDGASLLVAADCVPFAYPAFHEDLLAGKALTVGCPKLDDTDLYWRKLGAILAQNDVRDLVVAVMEVPCCGGLVRIVQQAVEASGKELEVTLVRIGIRGELLERVPLTAGPALAASPCGGQP